MKIKGDAETSARTGVSTYCVQEEDRAVWWTVSINDLIRYREWDGLAPADRRRAIQGWLLGENALYPSVMPHPVEATDQAWRWSADLSMLEQHAIVARNALRNFLGDFERLAPMRKLHLYTDSSAGWLGWITVNAKVESWVTTEGDVIEDARITYDDGRQPVGWTSLDGTKWDFGAQSHEPVNIG